MGLIEFCNKTLKNVFIFPWWKLNSIICSLCCIDVWLWEGGGLRGIGGPTKSQGNSVTKLIAQPTAWKRSGIKLKRGVVLSIQWSQRTCLVYLTSKQILLQRLYIASGSPINTLKLPTSKQCFIGFIWTVVAICLIVRKEQFSSRKA